MTNRDIWKVALAQSAVDCNCRPEDFLRAENVITISRADSRARIYLPLPFACQLISYGNNIVAQVSEPLRELVAGYINRYPFPHCFEPPHMHVLDDLLAPHGFRVYVMAEYFLPDLHKIPDLECPFLTRLLRGMELKPLYTDEWSNALCAKRPERDVLAVGAYDGARLIGLAGCSADCEEMYQIGVDVLPDYRRRGIAGALTVRLAREILNLGKVPFYCAAWSNIPSVRNAVNCGFRPAWVDLSVRETALVNKSNGVAGET